MIEQNIEPVLLRNCRLILTQNQKRHYFSGFDIALSGGLVSELGKNIEPGKYGIKSDCILDCSRKIAMPALFNAHTHSPMSLLRGYSDDQSLQDWLSSIWAVEAEMTPDDMHAGALYACMEMAKTGTFCFADMYFEMDRVAEACSQTGLNAFLGYGMLDNFDDEKRENEIGKTAGFIEWLFSKSSDPAYKNIKPVLAPHSIYTCSKELLDWVKWYSNEKNLLKTMHVSETLKEVYDCIREKNSRPVQYLNETGFLDSKTVVFHASWINMSEIEILAKNKVKAVNCPSSNMKLATGGAFPLREYEQAGVETCLGTDSACSNNSLDMFREMRQCALLQKWWKRNSMAACAQDVIDMATVMPAKAFSTNSGSIEPGKDASIILLDADHYSMNPIENALSNIVYSATGNCVSDMIVNGRFVLKNRTLATMDEEKIRQGFENSYANLMSRIRK